MPGGGSDPRIAAPGDVAGIAALSATALPRYGYHLPGADTIQASVTSPRDVVAVTGKTGDLTGCVAVSPLPWDSGCLGQRIARVSFLALRSPDEEVAARLISFAPSRGAGADGWDSVWMRVAAGDVAFARGAARAGAEFMGTLVTFVQAVDPGGTPDAPGPGSMMRAATASDLPALRDIASTAFRTDRYHRDPSIDPVRVGAMWAESVENSVRGRAAAVLVADPGAGPAGFITLHRDTGFDGTPRARTGIIGLVAVAGGMEGRGIGRALVESALDWFRGTGVSAVEVGTQGDNDGAMRLYGATGFVPRSIHLDFRLRVTCHPARGSV